MMTGGFSTSAGSRGLRYSPSIWGIAARALANQVRIIGLLIFREARTQISESPFRSLYDFFEPLIFIFGFYCLHEFLKLSSTPFGTSPLLFYATGFTPYFLFLSISTGVKGSAKDSRSLRNFPIVTPLDLIISRSFFELLAASPIYFVLFWGMWLYGISEATPSSIEKLVSSIGIIGLFGFGVGMINASISSFFPAWMVFWRVVGRLGMITSGVHRIPEYLPDHFRQYVVWNPMMHAVEWFRSAFFLLYPTWSLDVRYLVTWAASTFIIGLCFERIVRQRLYKKKKELR